MKVFTFAVLLVSISDLIAAESSINETARFFSLTTENDNYVPARDDRHYTNGLRIGYGFPKDDAPHWYDWLGRLIPIEDTAADREYEIAVGQNLYTPENFVTPAQQPNDRPYAGWLYAELTVTSHRPGVEESLGINLGIVGPAALGEEAQKFIHDITGDPEPGGWDNQLDDEPALLLRYRRSWFRPLYESDGLDIDLVPRLGISLGNVLVEAGAGTVMRFGSFLPERDLPLRIQPGLSGNSTRFDYRKNRTDWSIFAGIQGRAVGHNIFLDGNTDGDSLSVDRKTFVWDAGAGVALTFGQFENPLYFSFSFVRRGKEFEQQNEIDTFGSATFSFGF